VSTAEATIRGPISEAERETLAVLAAQKEAIQDGKIDGQHWLFAIGAQVADILRRRRALEMRRSLRT
jgi:hypothetical protein